MNSSKHTELANHAWSVADLLRGDYKQSDYGKVILPFTVLRRLECVLAPTKDKVLEVAAHHKNKDINPDRFLRKASGHSFYNTSTYTLKAIAGDASHAAKYLNEYYGAFSPTPGKSWSGTTSPSRSSGWPRRTCCTRWSGDSPISTFGR